MIAGDTLTRNVGCGGTRGAGRVAGEALSLGIDRVAGRSRPTEAQWWQAPGAPSDSAVRNEEPQPHAATALGLLTVKPAPISVST